MFIKKESLLKKVKAEIIDVLLPEYHIKIRPLAIRIDKLVMSGERDVLMYRGLSNEFKKLLEPFNQHVMAGMLKYPEHSEELKEYIILYNIEDILKYSIYDVDSGKFLKVDERLKECTMEKRELLIKRYNAKNK